MHFILVEIVAPEHHLLGEYPFQAPLHVHGWLAEWPLLGVGGGVSTFSRRLTGHPGAGGACTQSSRGSWKFSFRQTVFEDQEGIQIVSRAIAKMGSSSLGPLASHLFNSCRQCDMRVPLMCAW